MVIDHYNGPNYATLKIKPKHGPKFMSREIQIKKF